MYIYKVLTAPQEFCKAKGCIVPNLVGSRNGHRALEANAEQLNTRGGAWHYMVVSQEGMQHWIHEDARVPRQEMLKRSKGLHRSNKVMLLVARKAAKRIEIGRDAAPELSVSLAKFHCKTN